MNAVNLNLTDDQLEFVLDSLTMKMGDIQKHRMEKVQEMNDIIKKYDDGEPEEDPYVIFSNKASVEDKETVKFITEVINEMSKELDEAHEIYKMFNNCW